jgi:RNA polymerase sigma factor (sigma-70 family)
MPAWRDDFRDRIRWLVRRIAPSMSSDRREDVVQDAGQRYIEKLSTLRNPAAHIPFLNSIARNTLKEHLREDKNNRVRYPSLGSMGEFFDPPAEQKSVDSHLVTEQRVRMIMTAILTLPPRVRGPFVLRVLEEKKVREVADILGCSIGTVSENEKRAWLMLHEPLGRGYLVGEVLSTDDLPVAGAIIRISSITTESTAKGEFLLKFLQPGGCSLWVEAIGFIVHKSDQTIIVGRNEIGTIVLRTIHAPARFREGED